ncbi:MAG: hypothetical protein HKN70_00175 [Gammaproteobacteria bacterium]|nr:hypothetical protein [Gammaproteobacteria bacterium]
MAKKLLSGGVRGVVPGAAIVILFAGLTGCSWQDPLPVAVAPSSSAIVGMQPPHSVSQGLISNRLLEHFLAWEGVPYQYGGNDRNGIDCSAFVQQSLQTVLGVELPRTTTQQMRSGKVVDIKQARPGDMVFFRTGRRVNHVGVYLGSEQFMHASKSNGVAISRLDESYWRTRMTQVRRPHRTIE